MKVIEHTFQQNMLKAFIIFSKAEVYSNIKYIFGTQEPFTYIMTPIILLSSP